MQLRRRQRRVDARQPVRVGGAHDVGDALAQRRGDAFERADGGALVLAEPAQHHRRVGLDGPGELGRGGETGGPDGVAEVVAEANRLVTLAH
jgi:hypothetical protein